MTKPSPRTSWRSLATTAAFALATILSADLALSLISPVPAPILEVKDGVEMVRAGDPDTLVLGSSHTRSFEPLRQTLRERTQGQEELALVPVEWGIFSSYLWVLEHRLQPLIDEQEHGQRRRPSLKRVLLITTFYDMCNVAHIGHVNLPARAWEWRDFTQDVGEKGLTEFNRNFLQTHWKSWFAPSVLVQGRGHERVADAIRELVRPIREERRAQIRAEHIEQATRNMEDQYETCWPDSERVALDALLDFFVKRDIEPTIILFPLLPEIVSEKSKKTTLVRYSNYIQELGRRRGIRVVDMTEGAPLGSQDFQDDFDHLTKEANPRFAAWALEGKLSFLLEPAGQEGP